MVAAHLVPRGDLGAESILLEEPLKLNAQTAPAIANVANIIIGTADNVFIIIISFLGKAACWRTSQTKQVHPQVRDK